MKQTKRLLMALAIAAAALPATAQDKVGEFGVFDHVAAGLTLGTTGIGIDVAAPVTEFLSVRAGYSFMPSFSYKTDVDYKGNGGKYKTTEVEGKLNMGDAKLLVDFYPLRTFFRITAGFYVGKDEVVTVENTTPVPDYEGTGIEIGDYIVGFNDQGYAKGAIKVNSFKPYLGIGVGRAVPKGRVGFSGDFGVQFWGSPGVYDDRTGQQLKQENVGDNDGGALKTISKISVFPVLTFRIAGRIF